MSRTEEKVRDLVDDDPDLGDAIAVVMERAEQNGGSVAWADVNDDITSGQWGRMIEQGIVVDDGGGGFRIADADAVEEGLPGGARAAAAAQTAVDDDEEIETEGWSKWDKMAGVGVLSIMLGYYFEPVRVIVGTTLDIAFGPLDARLPFYAVILIIAMLTGVYSTILQANLMNAEVMKRQQEKMQALRDRKEAAKERGDDEALDRIQEEEMEMMTDQIGAFKEQFRPMVWITLLTIPIFLWMFWKVRDGNLAGPQTEPIVLPIVGAVEQWNQGLLGPIEAWIVWYFLCSMGFTQLIRKSINVSTGMSS